MHVWGCVPWVVGMSQVSDSAEFTQDPDLVVRFCKDVETRSQNPVLNGLLI